MWTLLLPFMIMVLHDESVIKSIIPFDWLSPKFSELVKLEIAYAYNKIVVIFDNEFQIPDVVNMRRETS